MDRDVPIAVYISVFFLKSLSVLTWIRYPAAPLTLLKRTLSVPRDGLVSFFMLLLPTVTLDHLAVSVRLPVIGFVKSYFLLPLYQSIKVYFDFVGAFGLATLPPLTTLCALTALPPLDWNLTLQIFSPAAA